MRLSLTITAIASCVALATAFAAPSSGSDGSICEPVTQTVTETITLSPGLAAVDAASSAMPTTSYSTITSFSTLTSYSYVTVPAQSTTPEPSSSGYYYIDNNGTTSWLGGAPPPTTYNSFVTQTVEITVLPTPKANPFEVIQTRTTTVTITPPAVTSVEPSSFTFEPLMTMSTITSYLTHSVTSTSTIYVSSNTSSISFSDAPVSTVGSEKHASHVSITRPPTSTTLSVALASESACSVHYTNVTTNVTYTILASATAPVMNTTSYSLGYGIPASLSKNFTTKILSQTATGFASVLPISQGSLSRLTSSSTLTKMYTNTTSSTGAMATPSVCGEHGDFVLTWEDEPNFEPTVPMTDPSEAPPVFNPYHHMYFSDGFVYMPPPSTAFSPVSSPRLVMYLANDTDPSDGSQNAGSQLSGEIGAGPRKMADAFWFNAYSAYLGCDNEGPEGCTMQISGLVYQKNTSSEVLAVQQSVTLPPCPGLKDCQLQQVMFLDSMKGLSGLRIQAFVGGERRSWFMDNLAMGWFNNSCDAGLLRIRSQ